MGTLMHRLAVPLYQHGRLRSRRSRPFASRHYERKLFDPDMPIRDRAKNLLAPANHFKRRFTQSRSDQSEKLLPDRSSGARESSGAQNASQLSSTPRRTCQSAERLRPSQPDTADADALADCGGNLSLRSVDGEHFSTDTEEKSSLLSNLAFFTHATLGVAKEFSDPCPPLKYAVTALLVAVEGFEQVEAVQDDFTYAAQRLTIMKITHENHRSELDASERMKPCLEAVARTIIMVERMLKVKSDRGIFKRIWEYPNDIKTISNALRMLGDIADYFVMNVTMSTHSMVQEQILDKLTFVESAHFLSVKTGRQCTEGTRTELLTNLLSWATAASEVPNVCLLTL